MITTVLVSALLVAPATTLPSMPSPFPPVDASDKAMEKRDRAFSQLQALIPKASGPRVAEMRFRLATLMLEQARAHRKNGVGTRAAQLEKAAMQGLNALLEQYPTYERNDEAIFQRAWIFSSHATTKKEGVRDFVRVIKQYPQSPYSRWSYAALARHYAPTDARRAMKAASKAARAQFDPLNAWVALVRAEAARQMGDLRAHQKTLEQMLKSTSSSDDEDTARYRAFAQRELDNATIAR